LGWRFGVGLRSQADNGSIKKITTPAVREEAEFICDVTGKPPVARLIMTFGCGWFRDGDRLSVHL
jgi:hypothetical protein